MARPVRIQVTIYTACDVCGPNTEHRYCASSGRYKCKCGRFAPRGKPHEEGVELQSLPLLETAKVHP